MNIIHARLAIHRDYFHNVKSMIQCAQFLARGFVNDLAIRATIAFMGSP